MTTSTPHTSPGAVTRKKFSEEWCEHVFQWLKKVQLSKELECVRNEINIKNVIMALDMMNGRVSDRLEFQTLNLTSFLTPCKDPATHANYPACE
eukprot:2571241-Amphidinium_carterae.1